MLSKLTTAEKAIEAIKDGDTIMVGGFLGTGSPEILIDALVKKGVKNLTVIGNDAGLPENQKICAEARLFGYLRFCVCRIYPPGGVTHLNDESQS